VFREQNPLAIDLLRRMLVFDPSSRISVEECLNHEYLAALHIPEDEPVSDPVNGYDFDFERQDLTARDLKDLLYEDILLHHFPEKVAEYQQAVRDYEAGNFDAIEEGKDNLEDLEDSSSDDDLN
jgi:serine/threonine protein kinase